jgi:glycosyltransferase involved in cell wall biosynthesis
VQDITVVVGGSIGADPYNPHTWSGSSRGFLDALKAKGLLKEAIGLRLDFTRYATLAARNFKLNRNLWRRYLFQDPAYRGGLTAALGRIPLKSRFSLQLGHWYSAKEAWPDHPCLSYHDGNLAVSLTSEFGWEGVSQKRIDEAFAFEKKTANQMDAVLTMSEYLRRSFIDDYHVPAERVYNVGGGMNIDITETVAEKDYNSPRMLFIGVDFERKGGKLLLEAFKIVRKSVPSAELHVVGPAALGPLPQGVVFHGRLSKSNASEKARLEDLFRQCSVFVLPSLYEPFGIAPLEAMFHRIPCILTNDWAFQEFVVPGYNGELVAKGSVDELVEAMKKLLSAPSSLSRMGDNARKHVLERYTWPVVADRIAEVISSLDLGRSRSTL